MTESKSVINEDDLVGLLKSALKRVVMVSEWCNHSGLPNVGADMRGAKDEIEKVIYKLGSSK